MHSFHGERLILIMFLFGFGNITVWKENKSASKEAGDSVV